MAKAIGYMKPDTDPNLRLYLPFNEGVGNVAKDYSQYGNHAQLTDVEWSPDGFNGAGKFNGSSSFGNCGNDTSLNDLETLSILSRFYLDGYGGGNLGRIIDKRHTNDDGAFILYNAGGVGNVQFGFEAFRWQTTIGKWFSPVNSAPLGQTYHLAVTYDYGSIANNPVLCINGSSVTVTEESAPAGTKASESELLYIGNRDDTLRSFDGTIDEVMIYALALSAAQNAADCYEVVCS